MKRGRIALTALLLIALTVAARADMELYIAKDTVTEAQGEALVRLIAEQMEEEVILVTQEADGRDFAQRMMDGTPPQLAILRVGDAAPWAREGRLAAMDHCAAALAYVAEPILNACITQERLYAVPLTVRRHNMAVRVEGMEDIRMGSLLDERMHPAWAPAQMLQVLDELALEGAAGLEIWRPTAADALGMEAFLQGACGIWLESNETDAREVDMSALEAALDWLEDLRKAGMIDRATDRAAALARFLSGETTLFIDWTPEESRRYAKELKEGRIALLAYPSTMGMAMGACDLVVLCAPRGESAEATEKALHAAALIVAAGQMGHALGERLPSAAGGDWLGAMETLEHGPTLRALICEAAGEILSGETTAQAAANRIARAMDTATK